jgi:LPXTG-site transpeptidase (sortase) family protein
VFRINERELKGIEHLLLGLGLALLGYVAWVHLDSAHVQWQFGRELAGDRQRVLPVLPAPPFRAGADSVHAALDHGMSSPDADGFLGVLEVPRLGLSTVIFEGIDGRTLRRSAGHIPGTSLPGSKGNVGIAGHRDRFFGGLKDLVENDLMLVRTPHGSYTYRVDSVRVVTPYQTEVLESSGVPELTLVTCYPFYFVGPAPERFIVFAHQIGEVRLDKPELLPVPVSTIETRSPLTGFEGDWRWAPHVPQGSMMSIGHPAFCSLSLPARARPVPLGLGPPKNGIPAIRLLKPRT